MCLSTKRQLVREAPVSMGAADSGDEGLYPLSNANELSTKPNPGQMCGVREGEAGLGWLLENLRRRDTANLDIGNRIAPVVGVCFKVANTLHAL